MWFYFLPHSMYHLVRWFPKNNRHKIRVVLLIFIFALLIPQFFVLMLDRSSRYCGQHLFDLLIASIVFSFFMIGFTILFTVMDPVPREVKFLFHLFGCGSFILGAISAAFSLSAEECKVTTTELYYLSLGSAVFAMITMVFFAVMIPFWLINHRWKYSVLDPRSRTGLCYEPVTCCSCLWHV